MKKIAALLLTAVMMLTFSSCASTELELKNRIIVEAIGIDYCDIGVRVTVQFLNADQSSNPNNGGTPDDIVKNMTIDSQNISSAIQSISKTLGKLPMMSQNRVIIFGNEAAKAGVGKALDYLCEIPITVLPSMRLLPKIPQDRSCVPKWGNGSFPQRSCLMYFPRQSIIP